MKISFLFEANYGLNVCALPSQNSYVEMLTPIVMVVGDGASGRPVSHEGGARLSGVSALMKGSSESCLASSSV